jgi:hypothetical protein
MIAPLLMAVALLPNGTYHYDTSVGGHTVGSSPILIRRSGGALDDRGRGLVRSGCDQTSKPTNNDLRKSPLNGYLEPGFAAEANDEETVAALLGHAPCTYEAFARESAASWKT